MPKSYRPQRPSRHPNGPKPPPPPKHSNSGNFDPNGGCAVTALALAGAVVYGLVEAVRALL